jgi:uridine kinase
MRTLMIGIAGGTGSGKTTVARRIEEALTGLPVAFLDQDAYYADLSHLPPAERAAVNFDHPDSLDVALLVTHLDALKAGRPIEKPAYSFVEHVRLEETHAVAPCPVVVVEGILVLSVEAIRERLDLKIYVDADDDVRVVRRIVRDVQERGRDLPSVVDQYFSTVRPMHWSFVEPSKRWADVIIPHGGHSDAAIDMVVGAIRARVDGHDRSAV